MSNLVEFYGKVTEYLNFTIPQIGVRDIIEIIVIAFLIYQLIVWAGNTRAGGLLRGIMFLVVVFMIAAVLQLHTILWLGEKFVNVALIALVVVFQPELRSALERLGRTDMGKIFSRLGLKSVARKFADATVTGIVQASFEMGAVKTGALIVVENKVKLTEYERTGIALDSLLTRQLLINIFEKNTPLHDGAVIVREDRIVAATCYLPLSENMNISKDLGTRHRAALGISEVSDALVVIVSEETGKVSIAKEGKITRNLTMDELTEELQLLQSSDIDVFDTAEAGKEAEDEV